MITLARVMTELRSRKQQVAFQTNIKVLRPPAWAPSWVHCKLHAIQRASLLAS